MHKSVEDFMKEKVQERVFIGLARSSDYWRKALRFYEGVRHVRVSDLAPKQRRWVEEIRTGLSEASVV